MDFLLILKRQMELNKVQNLKKWILENRICLMVQVGL